LNRTPATATNRKTWTWSGWVKRGVLGTANQTIFESSNGSAYTLLWFTSADQIAIVGDNGAGGVLTVTTNAVFRDPSAWYHIVIAIDTTQATANNRTIFYVNGVNQSLTYSIQLAQNADTWVNFTYQHRIGYRVGGSAPLDAYLAEVNFIDGQALTPSSFGSTNALTGVWQPARYTGTYGTNGFYLPFTDNSALTTSSNVGLGKDFSGNGNYWTTNNISITAGVTYDSMTDVPTLTSATTANYATWNPLINGDSATDGNLSVTNDTARGTQELLKYDAYWEITSTGGTTTAGVVSGTGTTSTTTIANTKTYGFRLTTTGTLDYINITDGGSFTNITTGLTAPRFPYASAAASTTGSFNAGQRPFAATPPTGFVALNTYNLPDSTIKNGSTVMDATTYTGTGASLAVTNAASFKPDLVWVKSRSAATDHAWYDSVRGTTKQIESNTIDAETTQATGLTSFDSAGFTVGALAQMNTSAATYVGWQWQAGQGSTSSNTSGTITSTVSVNASAGFSVVTYTGTGATATIGHGLGVAPAFIIAKNRGSGAWYCYHSALGASKYIPLNTIDAATTNTAFWNNTTPSSTVFSVSNGVNNNSAATYVAYCWTPIAGFSAFGSLTGNGSADGVFVYTGFRPKFVMIKRTDSTSNWTILDSVREGYNVDNDPLFPNLSNAEGTTDLIDILSNGFKLRSTDASVNASGGAYIYACWAETPFRNSLAR
jgi:hypothetical protein